MKFKRNIRTIELSQEQRDMVLHELDGQEGDFDLFIEVAPGIAVEAQGYVYTDGYREDDYYNGTGGFAETGRRADVILTVYVEHEDYEEVCDCTREFEVECYNYLQAA